MIDYKIVNSGSDGNATIINKTILIDCGVSFKKLKDDYKDLKVILLTHIHGDHFNKKTIKKLAQERPLLRFGGCEWLVDELINCGVDKKNIDVFEIGKKYDYKNFQLVPIKLYHDVPQCGYKVFINNNKLIYATDTKTLEGIEALEYDLYLIEANYESDEELHERAENEFYENRVKNTHLSREQATKWLLDNMGFNSVYEFMHVHREKGKKYGTIETN